MARLDDALFPAVPPRVEGRLRLDDTHEMHYEEVGRADGVPLVLVHGGPGGSIRPYMRQAVDPAVFRGVLFDQRGCGKSTPRGSLVANTTQDLVADLERLREHLGIDQWVVAGGSWGSTLALAYAEAHPSAVRGLVVTGVFLGDERDRWWWLEGMRFVYPELYDQRVAALARLGYSLETYPEFLKAMAGDDLALARSLTGVLGAIEGELLDVWPQSATSPPADVADLEFHYDRVLAHFESHGYFLEEGQLLRNAGRLAGIPGAVVSGRFDMCTPPLAGYDLHKAWPGSRMRIMPAAGHRWADQQLMRGVVDELARLA
jgi:proline iminopeptidase